MESYYEEFKKSMAEDWPRHFIVEYFIQSRLGFLDFEIEGLELNLNFTSTFIPPSFKEIEHEKSIKCLHLNGF